MTRKRKAHGLAPNPGRSPGTLIVPQGALPSRLRVTRYTAQEFETRSDVAVADLVALTNMPGVVWVEVEGLGSAELFDWLDAHFGVPRLALEDVLGNACRPKLDLWGGELFVVARAVKGLERPEFEQVSLFLRGNVVFTFVDEPLEVFTPLRERLEDATSLTRRSAVDFLVYRILDGIVDTYVPCLEHLGARLEAVEAQSIEAPSSRQLKTLYELLRELRQLARVGLPMRELVASLSLEARPHFHAKTLPFLADMRDHAQAVVELTAHYRDLGTDVRELIHGELNLRMNQVMRMLTAITTVFIPLSFVTGLYGMNFDVMPETQWRYGYFVVLLVLALTAWVILRWLRARGWTRVGDE